MYYIPLDVINGSTHLCCVLPSNSDTEHKKYYQTSKPEALACYVFNMKNMKEPMHSERR